MWVEYNEEEVSKFAACCVTDGLSLIYQPEHAGKTYIMAKDCYKSLQQVRLKKIMCVSQIMERDESEKVTKSKKSLFDRAREPGHGESLGKPRKLNYPGIAKVPTKTKRKAGDQMGNMSSNLLMDSPYVEGGVQRLQPINQSPSSGQEHAQIQEEVDLFSLRSQSTQ
jgi:hypothetical protein